MADDIVVTLLLLICIVVGLIITVITWLDVTRYFAPDAAGKVSLPLSENNDGEETTSLTADMDATEKQTKADDVNDLIEIISGGADDFLFAEYKIMAIFMVVFSIVVFVCTGAKGKVTISPTGSSYGVDWVFGLLSTVSFVTGCTTSIVAGYIGMKIAVLANGRVTMKCFIDGIDAGFKMAFKGGMVMGFGLLTLGLLNLMVLIGLYSLMYDTCNSYLDCEKGRLYDALAAYGLGGSSIALFGRVGGGIYTKAADVGADLVGKVEKGIPEDDKRNPATIADNVGDNVGDIAGMGSDLFGSFAEGTCAALVVLASANNTVFIENGNVYAVAQSWKAMAFPISITAVGMLVCYITSLRATIVGLGVAKDAKMEEKVKQVEPALKLQLLLSSVLMTPVVFVLAYWLLPGTFWVEANMGFDPTKATTTWSGTICNDLNYHGLGTGAGAVRNFGQWQTAAGETHITDAMLKQDTCFGFSAANAQHVEWWEAAVAVCGGLWAGLLIGYITEYYTSNAYRPVQEVSEACHTGAATNIIYGLALGYKSAVIPVFALAIAIYAGFALAKMFGVACAALGMLANVAICLSIDGYGPIADNAGGIAEMTDLPDEVRKQTDALDAAGNTTAAIGKGFAIGSAAMVALALFGGYCVRADIKVKDVSVLEPMTFFGLLIGSMLPYAFSAMTMKSVGMAAKAMVEEVRLLFQECANDKHAALFLKDDQTEFYAKCKELELAPKITALPNFNDFYARPIDIATRASLSEMLAPGALVMLSPLLMGIFFGKFALSGLLVGAVVSGVQMALSSSNTGGAWDNAKKLIEQNNQKGTDQHEAAVVGDTVGDPLKDTSGPAINILMKLMAIISLVFAPFIASTRDGYGLIGCSLNKACTA